MSIVISGNYISGNIKSIISTVAPTTATTGVLGQLYINTADNNKTYACTSISGNVFTWSEISGGSSSVSIDDVTITENSSNEIQAVGQIDSNSGNPTFDWIGDYQSYLAGRQAQTITDDMMCYITDDYDTPTDVVSDVQVNGTSIMTGSVADIPVASQDTLGVLKVSPTYGLTISNGIIVGSTKTAGVYSTAANSMAICKGTLENIKTTLGPDVQINGTSIVSNGVANIPIASTSDYGAVMLAGNNYGITVNAQSKIVISPANNSQIDAKTNGYLPIVPATLNYAVRSVQSAYTLIEPTASTYNLAINNCYGQIPSQAVTYTLPAVTEGVDNWVKIFVDTTTTASISIASADSKTLNPNGTTDMVTKHKYIIICQFNNLKDEWEVYIIDGGAV